jgi:RNA polymerase sigma-70 factor (ECF subfamily)
VSSQPPATTARARLDAALVGVGEAGSFDTVLDDLLARGALPEPLSEGLARDLALTSLWAQGRALPVFEGEFVPALRRALAKLRLDDATIDDVLQALRTSLFLEPRAIRTYRGQGDLRGFLRISAVRLALRDRQGNRTRAAEDALADEIAPGDDPELGYLKALYRPAFRRAILASIADLPERERTLLRQHVIDGLGIDQLSLVYGVHRATCARWLNGARTTFFEGARHHFLQEVPLRPSEQASLFDLVGSQLDLTLGTAFRGRPAA